MSTFADLQAALTLPIVQAPMAGGYTPPALVAAVSNAGALGSIGAGYLSADQIREVGRAVRQQTDRPFALNLFIPTESLPPDPALVQAWLDRLAPYHDQFGLPAPALPPQIAEPFDEQWAAVMDVRPAAFSFTFGRLPEDLAREAQRRDILVFGTATTSAEAQVLEEDEVDAIVLQGREAGGHRGTFLGTIEESQVPTLELIQQAHANVRRPLIASGGLMTAQDIRRALAAEATWAQLGTAFLITDEAGTAPGARRALQQLTNHNTALIRAYSGRAARGIVNAFVRETQDLVPLPYPYQNALTRPLRTAARLAHPEYLSLWAGEGVAQARPLPVETLLRDLGQAIQGEYGTGSHLEAGRE